MKLSNTIINKNFIQHIDINKDKFIIHVMTNKMDAFFMFGGGISQSYNTEIEVCKTKNLNDYNIITQWIDNELK
jgi:hypothetical protein